MLLFSLQHTDTHTHKSQVSDSRVLGLSRLSVGSNNSFGNCISALSQAECHLEAKLLSVNHWKQAWLRLNAERLSMCIVWICRSQDIHCMFS